MKYITLSFSYYFFKNKIYLTSQLLNPAKRLLHAIKNFTRNFLLNYVVEVEETSDGGLECIFKLAKLYRGKIFPVKLDFLISTYYPKASFSGLNDAAAFVGLTGIICKECTIEELLEYNQPCMIRIREKNGAMTYAVFLSYCERRGFLLWNQKSGDIAIAVDEFRDIWYGNECMVFIPNDQKEE